jgi:hypothetical protein
LNKLCTKCNIEKPLNDFALQKNKPHGRSYHCKECKKVVQNVHYNLNKEYYLTRNEKYRQSTFAWLREYKSTLSCCICGFSHPAAIDFHHRDPKEKIFNISIGPTIGKTIIQIKKEIDKCDIVCSNCHRIIHYKQKHATEVLPVADTNLINLS